MDPGEFLALIVAPDTAVLDEYLTELKARTTLVPSAKAS